MIFQVLFVCTAAASKSVGLLFFVKEISKAFEVSAPLCSYVQILVNGEEWGLYLAVEGVEDSFLYRNYGADYGELYKPDSMGMGGGRGNG